MRPTNPRELRALLERHGFRFTKGLGQNFIIDASLPRRIVEASGADEGTWALEVGPGAGCLTQELAARAARVTAVEKDARLLPVLRETLADFPNAEVVHGDILKLDLEALAAAAGTLTPIVCANLPYNITSSVLARLLEVRLFKAITVMVQREVAERFCAAPGDEDYGAFTVFVNWYAQPRILFHVPPTCFMPPPKVTSSVLRLDARTSPPAETPSEAVFFRVVRAAFAQRRKTLLNALAAGLPDVPKARIALALEAAALPPRVRGEELGIPEFARLTSVLFGN